MFESGNIFIFLKIAYILFTSLLILGVLYWAYKTNQFKDQDHFSRLPLEVPEDEKFNGDNSHV